MKSRVIAEGYIGAASVKITRSPAGASVWSPGDGLWWVDHEDLFHGLMIGGFNDRNHTRWSIWIEIEASTWTAVKEAVRGLGWTMPNLRAGELKRRAA